MVIRIIIGMISHETTTFSVIPADLQAFKARGYYQGPEVMGAYDNTNTPMGGFIEAAKSFDGVELIPTIAADATPSGRVTQETFEFLKNELIQRIKNAGKVDGIALQIHGAMVTEEHEDGEGVLLQAIRKVVGNEIPVVTTLDLHGNITQRMIGNATAFFGYNTNPHIDGRERGIEAFNYLMKILSGESNPVMARAQPPLMPHSICVRTDTGPLLSLFEVARQWEGKPGVIDVSIFGGWAHADIHDSGLSIIATTDGNESLAREIVEDLSKKAMEKKMEFIPNTLIELPEAVERALAASEGPVILAEIGDSPAAGSSGDGTHTLIHLIEVGAKSVAHLIKDPEAVAKAIEVGVGGDFEMYVGGKTDDYHGTPALVKGMVRAITDGIFISRGPMQTGVKQSVGRTAVINLGDDFELVITEKRVSPIDPQVFRQAGVEPTSKQIVVLKSGGHFRAAYTPMAKMILDVNTPGVTSPNIKQFEYKNVRRPVFPLDEI